MRCTKVDLPAPAMPMVMTTMGLFDELDDEAITDERRMKDPSYY
jgi:hypothetical protein